MGGKRAAKGKHFLFHGTCLIAIVLFGGSCALNANLQKRWQSHSHLNRADALITKGNYEAALNNYKAVASDFPADSPGDRAAFKMGIIWAHPGNPDRDYEKALDCFQKVVRDFPGSALKSEAKAWTATLENLMCYEKKISGLKEQLKTLKEIDIRTEERKREE